MTKPVSELLRQAFEKAAEILPEPEQDASGRWLLNLIEADERDWAEAFDRGHEELERLGIEAAEDFKAGRTEVLDPDQL